VGRHCRLTKAIIDRGCEIPDGLVVGEDAAADAARFERTENGIVLVTKQMLGKL
ncbi:MAG: glucose-1-phosphate adenylyltransferase, partial [Burkholderiales bacterium]|nr:glucose-1-phosphate adenylyltransferase [Burkholderiales bacterium]